MANFIASGHELISSMGAEEATQRNTVKPTDEAALIEERRKKREAIKAKHRGQATPTVAKLSTQTDSEPPITESGMAEEIAESQSKG